MQDQVGAAASYSQLGVLYQMVGELDQAEENSLQALQIRESLNLPDVYKDYGNLADIARARGDEEAAARWQAKCDAKVAELEKLRRGEGPGDQADKEREELGKFILALAQAAYRRRGSGGHLPPEAAEALAQLEQQAPPPLRDVAPFLRAVAGGQAVPSIPPGLPPQVDEVLRELVKAVAQLDAGEAQMRMKVARRATRLKRWNASSRSSSRDARAMRRRANKPTTSRSTCSVKPQTRPLGKALQRLLEGLRGADVLAGLPPELAPLVQAIESQL